MKIVEAIVIFLPIKVKSPNIKEHWAVRMRRTKEQRWLTKTKVESDLKAMPKTAEWVLGDKHRLEVTLKRAGVRFMDEDNLEAALKPIRDGVADALFPNVKQANRDNHSGIQWSYGQEKAKKRDVGIYIIIKAIE